MCVTGAGRNERSRVAAITNVDTAVHPFVILSVNQSLLFPCFIILYVKLATPQLCNKSVMCPLNRRQGESTARSRRVWLRGGNAAVPERLRQVVCASGSGRRGVFGQIRHSHKPR